MVKEEKIIEIDDLDVEYLFLIIYECFGDPETLSEKLKISLAKVKEKLLELEDKGLIKIHRENNKIIGSTITALGSKIYEDPKYKGIKSLWGYK